MKSKRVNDKKIAKFADLRKKYKSSLQNPDRIITYALFTTITTYLHDIYIV